MEYQRENRKESGWILTERPYEEPALAKYESIFTQGNGYMGLRNSLEERYVQTRRGMFVAGTFNKASRNEVTELPNLPDIVNMEISIQGYRFQVEYGDLAEYERELDLGTGETCRRMVWTSPAGDRIRLCFRRFVSYDNLHTIGNRLEIEALSNDIELKILSGIDAEVSNHGAQHFIEESKRVYEGDILQVAGRTTESDIGISIATTHNIQKNGEELPGDIRIVDARRQLHASYVISLKRGECVTIDKISVVHTSRDLEYHGESDLSRVCADALENIKNNKYIGYTELLYKSIEHWKSFWIAQDIVIDSDDDAQIMIRFALYHLHIMAKRGDHRVGIGAKGLSGEGYKGHSFWDTEIFIFPYFQMTDPALARTLLEYRYHGLYGARRKAEENHYEGAMYPWEAAWISDGEVTPYILGVNVHSGEDMICLTGRLEQHITADIISAVWQYYLTTKDMDFMVRYGYEMILETGRFWNSRLEWIEKNQRYEIKNVIGPDEYKESVDNNAYTNYMAYQNLQLTKNMLKTLREDDICMYQKLQAMVPSVDLEDLASEIARKLSLLYLPKPDDITEIIPQFDGYFSLQYINLQKYKHDGIVGQIFKEYSMEDIQGYQVGKQADIVELLYQMDIVDSSVKKKNYRYYEDRTLHDSSLSKATHSIVAGDLGLEEEAYRFFIGAALTDMGASVHSCDDGIHSANMGGVWKATVMGFGGVRVKADGLHIQPRLPKQWRRISYPIVWRGNTLRIEVGTDGLEIENTGEPVEVWICGNIVRLQRGTNIIRGEIYGAKMVEGSGSIPNLSKEL